MSDPAALTSPTGAPPQADAIEQRSAARDEDPAPGLPSSQEPPEGPAEGQGPQVPGPTPSVAPSLGAPPFPVMVEWGPDGATAPIVPDLLLAEVGADVMPKTEGPESLWSEAESDSEGEVDPKCNH